MVEMKEYSYELINERKVERGQFAETKVMRTQDCTSWVLCLIHIHDDMDIIINLRVLMYSLLI